MARVIEQFTASTRATKYPEEWLNGQIWELVSGEDFTGPTPSLRSALYGMAKRRGGSVVTRTLKAAGEPDVVQVQFVADEK